MSAAKAQEATGVGYACIDFLIDRDKGPLVVEIGARAGISIQLADQQGQRERLERVKGIKVKSLKHGIRLGKQMFGGEIEENIESLTGKKVIGLIQNIYLTSTDGEKIKIKAKVDTGAYRTSIDSNLAKELGLSDALEHGEYDFRG